MGSGVRRKAAEDMTDNLCAWIDEANREYRCEYGDAHIVQSRHPQRGET